LNIFTKVVFGVKMNSSLPGGIDRSSFFAGPQHNNPAMPRTRNPPSDHHPPMPHSSQTEASLKEPDNNEDPPKKSFWQRYKGLIVVLIVLFIIFVVVVIATVVWRKNRGGPALPPGVKMTASHAEDFSDKLQQFKDASEEIRRGEADLPDPRPLVGHNSSNTNP
jgi:hypothetical protein